MYSQGAGVSEDPDEAAKWYGLAAHQDHAAAQFKLGVLDTGRGVRQDPNEAVRWYRRAADKALPAAQFNLGLMYARGNGVPQDYLAAHMWANLAGARGHEKARDLRDRIAARMSVEQIAAAQRAAREWRATRRLETA